MNRVQNRRILLIDDLPSIHQDFRKILSKANSASALDSFDAILFEKVIVAPDFELNSAYQGQEGVAKVVESLQQGLPYAMAFVDMRMPPGWDGIETIKRLWQEDPKLQIVICTAYSDCSWEDVLVQLDACDRLLILKKPFDNIEVYQLANTLTMKWEMAQQAELHMGLLEEEVRERTLELQTANEGLLAHIVERKLVEQALRLKDKAIEASINAIFLTNNSRPGNPIEYVNPAFLRMTGYTAAEVMGKHIRFLLGQEQDQPGIKVILDAMQNDGEGHAVLRTYRKDGTLFWSECCVAGVHDNADTSTHFVVVLNDITETKQLENQLQHRANYDVLTKLPNRVLLMDRMAQAIAIADRQQRQMLVAFVDLDRFKFINDTLGHDAGDLLLQEIARRLCECVRESDTVARLGGDEFVILLYPESADVDPLSVVPRIVERIAQPVTLLGSEHAVSCSMGISVFPLDGCDAETLLKHADIAMYCAKELGRNNYQFYANKMNARIREKKGVQEGLRNALARNEFQLLYQPQIDLCSGQIIGVEALIRWQHPELGVILPTKFIPQAEETGLIVAIGEWVLHTACKQNKAWQDAGMRPSSMSVNVSARQFMEKELINHVAEALQASRLDARYLELELTESMIMQDPQQAIATMQQLQMMGVQLSIDDFGTGYSSLSALKYFPVVRLKIDQSFVHDIPTDSDDKAIAIAVISLGHQLNLKVIAEGVETEQQLAFLRDNNCDEMQGYHFSRPVSAAEIETLFRAPGQLSARLMQ